MLNKQISEIENFIISNGDRFKIKAFRQGIKLNEEVFKTIESIVEKHQSLFNYLENYVSTLNPNKVIIITKKYNGNSSGRDPVERVFEIEQSIPEQIQQPSLNGHQMNSIYEFQINSLNRELEKERSRADKYENLHHELRERNFELDKQLKTFEEKKSLEMERERIKQENSFSSVIKEVKPELFGLLGNMMNNQASLPASSALQGTENEKVNTITQTLAQLPEEMQNEATELIIRYLNSDAKQRGKILQVLRQATTELDEQINQVIHA